MKIRLFVGVVVFVCGVCLSQAETPSTNVLGAKYPRLNGDRSATFRVEADHPQKVQVLMDLGQAAYDMTKGEDGFWQVTPSRSQPVSLLPDLR